MLGVISRSTKYTRRLHPFLGGTDTQVSTVPRRLRTTHSSQIALFGLRHQNPLSAGCPRPLLLGPLPASLCHLHNGDHCQAHGCEPMPDQLSFASCFFGIPVRAYLYTLWQLSLSVSPTKRNLTSCLCRISYHSHMTRKRNLRNHMKIDRNRHLVLRRG